MKGGLVVMLVALSHVLKERGSLENVGVLLVPDEEQGSLAHHAAMEKIYSQYEYGLVFEGCAEQYSIIDRRRGTGFFTLRAQGKSGHSGYYANVYPNAISMLTQAVGAVLALQDPTRGTTINPGRIEGGTKGNIIAEQAHLICDVRFWDRDEFARVRAGLERIAQEHHLILEMEDNFWPLEESPRMTTLKGFVQRAAERLGQSVTYIKRGGASDASVMAACGVGVLDGWGVTGDGFHTIDEKMKKDSLATQATFTAETVLSVLKG
jgi:glutamate carboxypeptidase